MIKSSLMYAARGSRFFAFSVALAALAHGQFTQIVGIDDVRNDPNNNQIQNFLFDGSTLFVALSGSGTSGNLQGHAINRVTGVGGSPAVTNVMTSATWGTGFFFPIHSFQRTGDFIQFASTSTPGGIHRVDINSGALTTRFTNAEIIAGTPATNLSYLGASVTDSAGELYFANANSGNRALLRTNGTAISTLLDQAQLGALFNGATNQTINAMTLAGGSVIMANNNQTMLASYNVATSATSVLLTSEQLSDGGWTGNFARLFAAPDGLVYAASSNRGIFSFDPADPAGTWAFVLTTGTTSAWNIQALGWYADEDVLAFATTSGIYAVPEPSTYAVFFGVVALAFVWFRRRRA